MQPRKNRRQEYKDGVCLPTCLFAVMTWAAKQFYLLTGFCLAAW